MPPVRMRQRDIYSKLSDGPETSNESSNGRSVIGGYPQVRSVTQILQNPTSDGN